MIVKKAHLNYAKGQILTIQSVRVAEDGSYGFAVEGEPDDFYHAFDYRFKLLRNGGKS